MAFWLLILVVIGMAVYINQVGLPNFVKLPLLEKLRARGLDIQFSRLRWRGDQRIVAEHVRLGRADDTLNTQLALAEIIVALTHRALSRLKLPFHSLMLHLVRLHVPSA